MNDSGNALDSNIPLESQPRSRRSSSRNMLKAIGEDSMARSLVAFRQCVLPLLSFTCCHCFLNNGIFTL